MADQTEEIARLKTGIAAMLKRVPQSVLAGGINTTRAYKSAVEYAKKQVASTRVNFSNLQTAYTRLSQYE